MKVKAFLSLSAALIAAMLVADIWWFDPNFFRVAANVCLAAAAVLTTTFTVRYAIWSKWWASPIGPTYLAFKSFSSALLVLFALSTWWDEDFQGRQDLRFAIYAGLVLSAVSMIDKLFHAQKPPPE